MKLVLLQDVKALGKKNDIVNVNDGYARNYLIPRKLGVEANAAALNELKTQQANAAFQAAEQLKAAQELASKIGSVKLEMPVKVGGNGKLFGALSSKEIADAMKEQFGIDMDKKKIVLAEPIKEVGERTVEVKLHKDVTAKLALNVKAL
ncbi:MAG: 50S ribosomal protein L9 [Lachnospiraceae bacterium]|nr:50S ribosomal protein L9 [Lachnospiraceae bacterium]MBQ6196245.1 50S ribosomal protein L9 [Lachnospiraceae bacterium]